MVGNSTRKKETNSHSHLDSVRYGLQVRKDLRQIVNVGRHVFISADAETPACQQRTVAPLLSRERKRMLTASSNKKEDAYSLAPNPSFEDSQWIANKLVVEPKPLSDRIWINISGRVHEFLAERREIRAEKVRQEGIQQRRKVISKSYYSIFNDEEGLPEDDINDTDSMDSLYDTYHEKPYFRIPHRAFLALPSVREKWEHETPSFTDTAGIFNSTEIEKIHSEIKELREVIFRSFFDLLLSTQQAAITSILISEFLLSPSTIQPTQHVKRLNRSFPTFPVSCDAGNATPTAISPN